VITNFPIGSLPGQNCFANAWETTATEVALLEVGSEERKDRPAIMRMPNVEKKPVETLSMVAGSP
jgi:hypothetical protein